MHADFRSAIVALLLSVFPLSALSGTGSEPAPGQEPPVPGEQAVLPKKEAARKLGEVMKMLDYPISRHPQMKLHLNGNAKKAGGVGGQNLTPSSEEDPEWSNWSEQMFEQYGYDGFWSGWDATFSPSTVQLPNNLCSTWYAACRAQCKVACAQQFASRMQQFCSRFNPNSDPYEACSLGMQGAWNNCDGQPLLGGPTACEQGCGDYAFMMGVWGSCQ